MGQSSSRQRRYQQEPIQNDIPAPPVIDTRESSQSSAPSTIDTPSDPTSPTSSLQTPSSSSHSKRRSFLNFIKPSSRNRSDADITHSRNWRRSRRFSKTPANLDCPTVAAIPAEAIPIASSSNLGTKDVVHEGNVTQEELMDNHLNRPSTPSTLSPIIEAPQVPQSSQPLSQAPASTQVDTQDAFNTLAVDGLDQVPHITVPDTSNFSDADHESALETQPSASSESSGPTTQNMGQFPPSGTLVVVQGVVHTTDAPRPSNQTQPPVERPAPVSRPQTSSSNFVEPNESRTRNRLSSLLRPRPSSTASRPASIAEPPSAARSHADLATPVDSAQAVNDTAVTNGQSVHPSSTPTDTPSPADPPTNNPPTNISSSSVEVLGTLLSVAAAATAASLLTGNSEAIFPSQDAPPSYSTTTPTTTTGPSPNSEPWTMRPTSPTPTAGLGDPATSGRTERLRQAWGGIRERLGLRPAGENGSDSNRAATNPNDPRELVLAQMARAFNLGFGMNEPGSADSNATGADGASPPNTPQLPPEGSFERFLVDLQADLRVTLTNQDTTSDAAPPENAPSRSNEQHEGPEDSISSNDFADVIPEHALNTESSLGSSGRLSHSLNSDTSVSDAHSQEVNSTHEQSLQEEAPGQTPDPDDTSNPSDAIDAQGRINWWRLYRFPPITAPTRGSGAATTQTSTSALPTSQSSPPSSTQPTEAADMSADTASALLPQPPQGGSTAPRSNIVVPVIVVGLQSVHNADWPGDQEPEGEPTNGMDSPQPTTRPRTSSDPSASGPIPPGSDASNRRSRGWHSRAADAIRGLRTGRRSRTNATTSNTGSRTFLIYVIGGYYPPDHNIVTGGSNNLDSFEALLELADLLGQVKPPTATKDDIEKSGLEVIQASLLDQYVNENKISSNCVERCLICLDDYVPEEDVRVMKCRHAFHRSCVDKWLETGRNNCPACRSKGVVIES